MRGATILIVVFAVLAAAAVTYAVVSVRRTASPVSISAAGSPSIPFVPEAAGSGVIYENTEDLRMIRGADGRIEQVIRKITVTRTE